MEHERNEALAMLARLSTSRLVLVVLCALFLLLSINITHATVLPLVNFSRRALAFGAVCGHGFQYPPGIGDKVGTDQSMVDT